MATAIPKFGQKIMNSRAVQGLPGGVQNRMARELRFSGQLHGQDRRDAAAKNGANGAIPKLGANAQRQARLQKANPTRFSGGVTPPPTGGTVTAPPETTPPPTTDNIVSNGMGDESSSKDFGSGMGDALFPSMRAMEPENYQGSPLYDWQKQQGEKSLSMLLNKRGLTNSGAEIEAMRDFNTQLGATEADKARGYAQNEADRLERIQQQEANRLERRDDANFDRGYKYTDLMLRQNPMPYAMGGTDAYAGNIGKEASTMANYLNNIYSRAISRGGSSGGGKAPFIPPFASGPDYSQIDQLDTLGGGNNNNGFFNSILKGIGGLF